MMTIMETPQTEKGFIQIASGDEQNDILMALIKAELSGSEYQICLLIIRKTWGYKKKEDWISLTQFEKYTGKSRTIICRSILKLVNKNILVKKSILGKNAFYSFNKDFNLWDKLVNKRIPVIKPQLVNKRISTSKQKDTQLVNKSLPTKDNITKDNIQKIISKDVALLINMFSTINPSYKIMFKNKTQRLSATRLLEQYGIDKLTQLMEQLPSIISKPYAPSITSPYELEVKMGKLLLFMQQEKVVVNKFKPTKI